MIWTSPQYAAGDPLWQWAASDYVYDEDTTSFAFSAVDGANWGFFINVYVKYYGDIYRPIDRIRFWAYHHFLSISTIDLDIYVQGVGWQHMFENPFADRNWTDIPVPGGPLNIRAARFRFFNDDAIAHEARLFEVDFNIIPGANRPKVGGNLARNILVGGSLV